MKKIARNQLPGLLEKIASIAPLFAPVRENGSTRFAQVTDGNAVDLTTLKTSRPPKDLFFPQCETLYTTSLQDGRLTLEGAKLEEQDFVVFGIRPCDAAALEVLDRVFLTQPVDTYYAARRSHGCLISLACNEPDSSCFCASFGIDPAQGGGDVRSWLTRENVCFEAVTEKGEKLLAQLDLAEGGEAEAEETKASIHTLYDRLPQGRMDLKNWEETTLLDRFNAPQWEELSKMCLGCGSCTFVCPTCQCYDIKDYRTASGVQRYRCWDSCMYSDFTMMAHGNNRTTQMQRYRQRFMHKLVYYPTNNEGIYSCVGCGRCVEKCPQGLHIRKVLDKFAKEGTK